MTKSLRLLTKFKHILRKAGVIACLFFPVASYSQENTSLKKLSNHPVWLSLLHYKEHESDIDDPKFFLSPIGKTDPYQELIATVKAFEESKNKGDSHPVCRYPARYNFLKKHIKIRLKQIPECKKLKEFLKEINPYSISVIFSDAYINSPASMYGHTFLRIDPPVKSKLLGYAVNYAAQANRADGFMYYIKGIFGLYKGKFSIFPYYKKIFEYNNLESRDLWEYTLNVSKRDVYFITLHLWELKENYSYYYFFDKNCSYQILHLIDLVRKNSPPKLVEQFRFWTIPVDTIRALKEDNLITTVNFRPSASSKIKIFLENNKDLSEKDIKLAVEIGKGSISPDTVLRKDIPQIKKAKILELGKLIFMYYSVKNRMNYKEYKEKLLHILKTRSRAGYPLKYEKPKKIPPDKGHKSKRFSLGTGSDNGEKMIFFSFRTAYHSLEDNDDGYVFGSEVVFPEIKITHYPDLEKTVIDQVNLISIKSHAIRDILFSPVSWNVYFGYKRDWYYNTKSGYLLLNIGTGLSYGKESQYVFSYGIDTQASLNTKNIKKSETLLKGKTLFLTRIGKVKFISEIYPFVAIGRNTYFGYHIKEIQALYINTNTSVVGEFDFLRRYYKNYYSFTLSLNKHF